MAQENSILKTAGADYDAVVGQMAALRDDMERLAHNVRSTASSRSHAMAQDVTDGMNEAVSYLGRKGRDADARVEGAVAANPFVALGLAALVGLVLGAMARR
jgi:ElaB/YqjD/DUF883 family membrane-anchored ribosome-binding protein